MKKLLLILLVVFAGFSASAQISGIVTGKENGDKLIGATVYIIELGKGTVTNTDGQFSFNKLPNNELTLKVSYIGYQTKYVKWHPGEKDYLNIKLAHTVIRQEEVVVTAGFSDTQHKNAIAVDFLDSKTMQMSPDISVNQLLAKFPGVDVAGASPAVSQPVIRGLSGTNILVLNNGIRLENYQFSRNHPFLVDEDGIERIEIIKGPASLLYGSDAVGGVINFISELPAPVNQMEADFRSRYFSNTSGFNTTMGVKQSSDHFNWGIRGTVKSHGDYHDGDNNPIPNSRYVSKVLKGFAGYNFKNGSTRFFYNYTKDDIGVTVSGIDTLPLGDTHQPKYNYQDLYNHFLISKTTLFLGNVKYNANFAYQINNRKFIEGPPTPEDEGVAINSRLNTFNYDLKAQTNLSEKVKAIFGIQGMYRKNVNHEAEGAIIPDATLFDISAFGFFQYTANDKFVMQGGMRYDYRNLDVPLQERKVHSHGEEGQAEAPGEIELHRTFNNISASVGATYHLSQSTLLRANLASAFRAPNLAELTQAGVHAGRHEEGNPDLNAQRSYEMDLGIHSHYELITFDFSAYYNSINNYIFLAPTGDIEDGMPVYEYRQAKAFLTGAETGIHYHPKAAKWLHLSAMAAYVYAGQNDGSPLPFIPPLKGNFEIQFEKNKWGMFSNSFFQIDIDLAARQNNPSEFETSTPGYYLLNTMIGTSLDAGNMKFDFSVSANNLLNREYVDHLNLLKPLGYFNMGRNITAGITIRF